MTGTQWKMVAVAQPEATSGAASGSLPVLSSRDRFEYAGA